MSKQKVPSKETLIELYVDKKLSTTEIAKSYGCTITTVCRALERAGIKRRLPKGKNHGMWKGGRITKHLYYWGIHKPNHRAADYQGYVYEHTLVMEKHLGRNLTKEEVVHHIDLDGKNNDLSNLYLCNNSVHAKIHHSIPSLIKPLLEKGIIEFKNGEYKLTKQETA